VKIQNNFGINQNNIINSATIKKPNNITKHSSQNTIVPVRSNSKQKNEKNERPSTAPSKNDIKDKNTSSLSNNPISNNNNNSIPLKRLPSPAIRSNNPISNSKLGGSMKYRSQSPLTLVNQNNNNNKNYNMYSFKAQKK